MSFYAELDNAVKSGGDVATTHGWTQFAAAVDALEAEVAQLRHLAVYGWCQQLLTLEADLQTAIDEGLDADNDDVAKNLLEIVKARADAECIILTDGCGVAAETEETEPVAGEESDTEQNVFQRVGDQLALLEAEAVVAETLQRLERMEANEALRAAKEPRTFLARLDTFYVAHVERMREALDRPVRTMVLLRDGPLAGGLTTDCEIDQIINEHVGGKRAALLQVSGECKPNELPGRVAEVVKEWGHAPS